MKAHDLEYFADCRKAVVAYSVHCIRRGSSSGEMGEAVKYIPPPSFSWHTGFFPFIFTILFPEELSQVVYLFDPEKLEPTSTDATN